MVFDGKVVVALYGSVIRIEGLLRYGPSLDEPGHGERSE